MRKPKKHPVYPMGARITFADDGATVALHKAGTTVVLASGVVNGPPVDNPETGAPAYVPCWCDREGREATTVYVAVPNIVEVVK